MLIARTKLELRQMLSPVWSAGEPIALVPTMGYFHAGHLSLLQEAKRTQGLVVVSLFVNPTQFGAGEDLARYPRDEVRDTELAAGEGADVLFIPSTEQMYPGGRITWVEVPNVSERLCGYSRPVHFRGVATVVTKLFNLVRPTVAFFGAKDYQQTVIIRRIASDLDFPVEVRTVPTVRESDGLAMSSRNVYLSSAERKAAGLIPLTLDAGLQLWVAGASPSEVCKAAEAVIASSPLLRPDYVAVVNPETLEDFPANDGPALLALAVYVGRTRLIDNRLLP